MRTDFKSFLPTINTTQKATRALKNSSENGAVRASVHLLKIAGSFIIWLFRISIRLFPAKLNQPAIKAPPNIAIHNMYRETVKEMARCFEKR